MKYKVLFHYLPIEAEANNDKEAEEIAIEIFEKKPDMAPKGVIGIIHTKVMPLTPDGKCAWALFS